MQLLSHQGRESKESGLLRLHREAWLPKWQQLARRRNAVQRELKVWRAALLHEYWKTRKEVVEREEMKKEVVEEEEVKREITCWKWVEEMIEWEAKLAGEKEIFERRTLHPVYQTVEKLKCWLKIREKAEAEQAGYPQGGDMMRAVCAVRGRLEQVWCELEEESVSLCTSLASAPLPWGGEVGRKGEERWRETVEDVEGKEEVEVWRSGRKDVTRRLPSPLLSCPRQDLQASLMQEFSALDTHFQDVLDQLQVKYGEALR